MSLVENKDIFYRENERLLLVSPDIEEACIAAAKDKSYSSAWTILAAASVLGCPIQSVYPPRNGILDKAVGILNQTFYPLGKKRSKTEPVIIMWTGVDFHFTKIWTPNHFVPIVGKDEGSLLELSSLDQFPELPSASDSRAACPTIFHSTMVKEENEKEISLGYSELSIPPLKNANNNECFTTGLMREEILSDLSENEEQINISSMGEDIDSDHSMNGEQLHESGEECSDVNKKLEKLDDQHMKPLKGKFLQTDEVIDFYPQNI
jgi:hypothetical protein